MTRPHTRSAMLVELEEEFTSLQKLTAPLIAEELTRPGILGEWSVKDILAHLFEWQRMFFTWYEAGLRGEAPAMPAPGYNWAQLAALNQAIYMRYRDQPLEETLAQWRASHLRLLELARGLDEETLCQPGCYAWTGKHALLGFISSNGGNHYRWASTLIRKGLKRRAKES